MDAHDDPDGASASPGAITWLALLGLIGGIAVGIAGGLFRWCLNRLVEARGAMLEWAHGLGALGWLVPVLVVGICTAGAAYVVKLVPLAAGSGIQHVEAVERGDAEAPSLWVLPAKFFGGLLALGSGLVLGREGPTVHMGAVIGAETARIARRDAHDVRALQTSLGGAGLAVAFGAPIGGALFVFEEVAKRFSLRIVIPTTIGIASAVGVSRIFIGDQPVFMMKELNPPGLALLPVFIVFGLLTGVLGVLYNRMVTGSLELADRMRRVPPVWRAGSIGAVVGAVLFIDPLAAAGGDIVNQQLLGGVVFAAPLLALYLLVRLLLGPFCYAAGTPGGLFTPLLAVGALWGVLFSLLIAPLVPGPQLGAVFALVGMSTFFAATVRAPFTGVVIVMEMTTVTGAALPMLAAAGSAVLAATWLRSAPIYDDLRERMMRTMTARTT